MPDFFMILPEGRDPETNAWTGEPRVPDGASFAIIGRWQHPTTKRWFFGGRLRLREGMSLPALVTGMGGAYQNEWGTDPDGTPRLVRSLIGQFKDAHPLIFERLFPTTIITNPDGTITTVRPGNVIFLGDTPEPEDW